MSGSKGNCFLVKDEKTQILVDAGITYKKYTEFMTELKCDPLDLAGILISHEHSDHISGAGVLHRKTKTPLYISQNALPCIDKYLGTLVQEPITFLVGDYIEVGSLIIHPFISSHDAIDSCNFLIYPQHEEERKLAIVTDLGIAHNLLKKYLSSCSTIILESNHDVSMLKKGPYPWPLKQRILSKTGHLSNEQARALMEEVISQNHKQIILTHLSEINNTPEIAYREMKNMLININSQTKLFVASQYQCTELFHV